MGKSYSTLAFYPEKCDGCGKCEQACAQLKAASDEKAHSRIRIIPDPDGRTFGLSLCRQCGEPRCVMSCPAGALTKSPDSGVVLWDEVRCVSCGLCTLSCTYSGITCNELTGRVMKCDMCEGDPVCAAVCPTGALELKQGARIYNAWGDLEDLFVPGISACLGCNSELFIRHTLRCIGPETVVATPPGCVAGVGSVGVNGYTATKTPVFHPLLTNTAAMLAGARRYYNRIGRDVTMLAFAGTAARLTWGFSLFPERPSGASR